MATPNALKVTILGCGYVGQAVARHWQDRGLNVTATTTTPGRLTTLETQVQQAVLVKGSDRDTLSRVLQDQDTLLMSVGAPSAEAYRETYLETAESLAAVLPHTSVAQVIYTGSYAVYGDRQGEWVTEADAVRPANLNGEILVETERTLLALERPGRQVCVLRLGGIYGPGRELIKIFRRAAGTTRPGSGKDATNWIHLDDIVATIDFVQRQGLSGIYNLVQDSPPTTGELLEYVMQRHGLSPVRWNSEEDSKRPYNARVSNAKLKQAGYDLIHPLFPFQTADGDRAESPA